MAEPGRTRASRLGAELLGAGLGAALLLAPAAGWGQAGGMPSADPPGSTAGGTNPALPPMPPSSIAPAPDPTGAPTSTGTTTPGVGSESLRSMGGQIPASANAPGTGMGGPSSSGTGGSSPGTGGGAAGR